MSRPLACLAVLALAGCAALTDHGPTTLPQVKVPVLVPCNPPEVATPTWPLDSLPADATMFEWVQRLYSEWELRKGYESQLETAVNSCRSGAPALATPQPATLGAPAAPPASPGVLDRLKGLFGAKP